MRVCIALVTMLCVSGCSIHPSTEDFSRDFVPDIVRKVKCEARDAVLETVEIHPPSYLLETGVAFAFDFIMDETNDAGSIGTFGIPVPNGSIAIGFDLSETKNRKTQQRITIADTFGDLVKMEGCDPQAPGENFKYPITGNIGLLSTFQNYRRLMNDHSGDSLIGTFDDEIGFKTDLGASVSSRVKLTAVSTKSLDVSGGMGAARSDLHRVKLTFTPAANSYQLAEKVKRDKVKRTAELKRLRQEKSIPTVVRIENGDAKKLQPNAGGQSPTVGDALNPNPPSNKAARAPQRPSNYEIKEDALRALERSDSRAFQDTFRREFEER